MAVGFLVLVGLGLGVAAYFLAQTQAEQREALSSRYADRTKIAGGLLNTLFRVANAGQTADLTAALGDARVTRAQVDAYVRAQDARWGVVLDKAGQVLARSSAAPTTRRYAGDATVRSAASLLGYGLGDVRGGMLETALGFPTAARGGGRRTLVLAAPAQEVSQVLTGLLSTLRGVRTSRAYVLDGRDNRIAAFAPDTRLPPRTPALLRIQRLKTRGSFTAITGERRFFASQPVQGSRWRLVLTVSEDALFEPVNGWNRWGPWLIYGLCALAVVGIALLLRRLATTARALGASNRELARSNADLEQFAYVASHDLSEPLRTVAGFSSLLSKRYAGKLDANADLYISHMAAGVDRMQQLIDDLLAYSRVGRKPLAPEPVDLDELLGEVLQAIDVAIRERGAQVTADDLPVVLGEPGQLRQVLQNLIANAVKFTRPGETPVVHVSAARDGRLWRIDVRDNGIGVPEDQREAIFKMFGRLHRDSEYQGTGIGLALVRRIVERHGGRVWAEAAAADNGGSVFSFTLPGGTTVADAAPAEKIPA